MRKRMDNVVEYMRKSKNRLEVLKVLGRGITTAPKISSQTRMQLGTVRSVINDLMRNGLVKKAVGKTRRPMLYETTSLGKAALQMKDAAGNIRWKGSSNQRRIARTVGGRF